MADDRKAGDAGGRHRLVDRKTVEFGSRLREARERKGVSLRDIANATKISVRALEALERNDISHLPGGIFSRSFVRAYAVQAGLNPDETVDDFVRQFPHDSVIAGHPSSTPIDDSDDESNRRTARVVFRLVAITVPLAAIVLYFTIANRRTGSVNAVPTTATSTASASTTESAAPQVAVEINAVRSCTLTVSVDGRAPAVITLDAGGRQAFDARTELTLTVNDPSAIEFRINGLRGRTLGPAGAAATVHVTPDNYRELVATP